MGLKSGKGNIMKFNIQKQPYRKILIAVDKFKDCLTAKDVGEAINKGIRSQGWGKEIDLCLFPMADGGEGSMDIVETALKGKFEKIIVETFDPLGRKIWVPFLALDDGKTAFIEMALVSGLNLVKRKERNLTEASTYGLGILMLKVIRNYGVKKIIMAIGGSATNDGGVGMLHALGFDFEGDKLLVKEELPKDLEIEVACDVRNPLLGDNGATKVYGKQKGGIENELIALEERMRDWAYRVQDWSGKEELLYEVEGAGAAGGVGFALHAVLGAKLLEGWKVFSDLVNLESEISDADLVITGEGCFDSQSLSGKLVSGIAELARKYSKPLFVVCGKNMVEEKEWRKIGISKVISLEEIDPINSFSNAESMLSNIFSDDLV